MQVGDLEFGLDIHLIFNIRADAILFRLPVLTDESRTYMITGAVPHALSCARLLPLIQTPDLMQAHTPATSPFRALRSLWLFISLYACGIPLPGVKNENLNASEEGFTIVLDRATLPDPPWIISTKQSRRDHGRMPPHQLSAWRTRPNR